MIEAVFSFSRLQLALLLGDSAFLDEILLVADET
jgi:hypothetical protein